MTELFIEKFIPDEIRKNISQPSIKRKFIRNYSLHPHDHSIHVLQWNILAQALSYTENNFIRTKNEAVAYETRKWRILEQILQYQPDLCSLQEMDIYDCFLKDQLSKYGYSCFFTAKPDSQCLSFEDDVENFKGPDGILLCYKNTVFDEIHRHICDLSYDDTSGKQVFSLLELKHKPSSSSIIFIGVHFKAKTTFATARCTQAELLVKFLNGKYSLESNIIIAGDFNGEVDEPFYKIILQSGLNSAYRVLMNNQEPTFTTWRFKARDQDEETEEIRTIDYIFYLSKKLLPVAYLEFPSKDDVGPDGLPSPNYPSDHLALQTIFLIRK